MNEDLNEFLVGESPDNEFLDNESLVFPDSPVDESLVDEPLVDEPLVDEPLDFPPEIDGVTNAIEDMGDSSLSTESIESENTENNEFGEAVGESEITTEEAPDSSNNVVDDIIVEDNNASNVPSDEIEPDVTVTEEIPTTPSDTIEEPVLEDDFIESEGSLIGTPDLGGRFNPHGKAVEENKKTFKDIFTDVLAKVKVSLGLDKETLQAKREKKEVKDVAKEARRAVQKGKPSKYEELDEITKLKIDALATALFHGHDVEKGILDFKKMASMAVNMISENSNANVDKVFEGVVDELSRTSDGKLLKKFGLLNVESAVQLSEKLGACNTSEEVLKKSAEHNYGIKVEFDNDIYKVIGIANSNTNFIKVMRQLGDKQFGGFELNSEGALNNLELIDLSDLKGITIKDAQALCDGYAFKPSDPTQKKFPEVWLNDPNASEKEKSNYPIEEISYDSKNFSRSVTYPTQSEPFNIRDLAGIAYSIKSSIEDKGLSYDDSLCCPNKISPSFFENPRLMNLYADGVSEKVEIPYILDTELMFAPNIPPDFFKNYDNLNNIHVICPSHQRNNLENAINAQLEKFPDFNISVDYDNKQLVTYAVSPDGNLTAQIETLVNREAREAREAAKDNTLSRSSVLASGFVSGQQGLNNTPNNIQAATKDKTPAPRKR